MAAELNIGKETIAEFLRAKGFDISPKPTEQLSQEMYDLVMDKFEKEHRQIEKQRKKVDAYHEKRVRPKDEAATAKKGKGKEATDDTAPAEESPEEVTPVAATEAPELPVQPLQPLQPEPPAPIEVEVPATAAQADSPVAAATAPTPSAATPPPTPAEIPHTQPADVAPVQPQQPTHSPATAQTSNADASAPVADLPPQPVTPPPAPVVEAATEAEPATPTISPEERAAQLEAARRSRIEELRRIAMRGRETEEPPAPEPEPIPEPEPTPEPPPPVATEGGGKDSGFVSPPPKLQGLTVLGKIEIGGKKEKEKEKDKKRTRTRTRGKAIDINAEATRARTAGGTTGGAAGTTPRPNASQTGGNTGRTGTTTGATTGAGNKRGRKGPEVDRNEVNKQLSQTFSRMGGSNSRSGRQQHSKNKRAQHEARAQAQRERESAEATILRVTEFVTVAELANLMNVDVSQVIGKCIGLGLMVSINQRLDRDTIQLVSDEFGYTVEFTEEFAEDALADTEDAPETLTQRAPIVTIMGHVDHGKTSLLDHIRSANVVAGEAGGITQHIGAYSVTLADKRKITFLDTPGHEAFTAMRARGAQVTDIVVLIVAADDAVMPQTLEAISHAQAANVPMIITINKIDKPDANPDRIKQQLADRGILVEQWGGKYQCVEISARQGLNVDKLLDAILLEAELLDLKANPNRQARGVVIESEIDRGKGVVATVLVQKGTLKVGDAFVAGHHYGRVRAMMDERGQRLQQVGPSEPAQILGFDGPPTAGDVIVVMESDRDAREIATRRQQVRREQEFKQGRHLTLDELSDQIARGGVQNLPLIIKGDVDGSVEALADALLRLSTPEVQVTVIMKSVGEISESDVLLATASNAIIIGFHVRPNLKARKLAEREGVEIRTYQIIYDTVNEVRAALEGMLKPEFKEVITATVEVRDIFKISRVGTIAGCYVQDGKIVRNDKIRLLRDGLEVFSGSISSLRRIKDDAREVEQGYECGITLDGMNDIKQGDVIEAFKMVEVKRKLETAGTA